MSLKKGMAFFAGIIAPLAVVGIAHVQEATCKLNGKVVPCDELGKQVGSVFGWGLLAIVLGGVLFILTSIFWIKMIIHAATHPIPNRGMWIVLIVLTGIIGATIYYFSVKRKMNAAATVGSPTSASGMVSGMTVAPPPQLVQYVREATSQGFTKEQIKKTLIDSGWNPDDVERSLR